MQQWLKTCLNFMNIISKKAKNKKQIEWSIHSSDRTSYYKLLFSKFVCIHCCVWLYSNKKHGFPSVHYGSIEEKARFHQNKTDTPCKQQARTQKCSVHSALLAEGHPPRMRFLYSRVVLLHRAKQK